MALAGEAKREWRRKNREKHKQYLEEWKRNNPEKLAAQAERCKAKRAARPEAIANRLYTDRLANDPTFAEEVCDRRKQAKLKRRTKRPTKNRYADGWTYSDIERIVGNIEVRHYDQTKSEWKKKADVLARGLRFMASLSHSEFRRPVATDWDKAIKCAISALIRIFYEPQKGSFEYLAARIVSGINKRRRIINEKEQNQEQ